jgi:hypothetical protein
MVPDDFPRLYWLAWLLMFGVLEGWAVYTGRVDHTFSYWVWWILGSGEDTREWFRWVARAGVLVLLIWLIPHFFTKWEWFRWDG